MYAKQSEPKDFQCQIEIQPFRSRPHCGLSRITILYHGELQITYRTRGRDSVVASMVTCSVEKPTCQRERSLGSATSLLKTSLHVS
jgi:hypothetical protein